MIRTNKVSEKNSSRCSLEFSRIFAKRLKKAREYKELTQEKVAEKLEISPRTYQHYESDSESNVRVPNLEIVSKLSEILDCDITYLTGKNEENVLRKDIQNASETTGLQYDTVDIISNFSLEQKQILNLLTLSNKPTNLGELLKDFYDYTQSSLQHGIIIDDAVEDDEKKERSIHVDELLTIRRFDISNKINNMLESLRALYWNKILKQGVEIKEKQDEIHMEDFANALKRMGATDKEIAKRISEVSASSGYDEIYNNLKI